MAKKINIPFDQCEVKSREYNEEIVQSDMPSRIQIADALGGNNIPTSHVIEVSVILYRLKESSGRSVEFRSPLIEGAVEALRYGLSEKKNTIIYVDRKDEKQLLF